MLRVGQEAQTRNPWGAAAGHADQCTPSGKQFHYHMKAITLLSVYPRDILMLFLKRTCMWTFTLSLIVVLRCWRKSKSSSLEKSTCETMLCFVRHNEACITAVQTEVKSSTDWKIRNRLRCISWYQHITKWCARRWSHNVVQYSMICRKKKTGNKTYPS